jgi:succinyl-diaminopimelate desuccinylase
MLRGPEANDVAAHPDIDPSIDADAALRLTEALVRVPSVTPDDQGCQAILTERLEAAGFAVQDTGPGPAFYARIGTRRPVVCLAGHTDVVPAGPTSDWSSDPFTPTLRDGLLVGRGVADMKGALAAMVCAAERYLAANANPPGSIAFLVTGDEEQDGAQGTARMVDALAARDALPDFCIVGEPSSTEVLGDTIKHGRRGSVTGRLTVHGVQGHVAFPERAENPIHRALAALDALAALRLDEGDADFPPTTLQMSNIHAGTGATNVIPGHLEVVFNIRYSPASTPESIAEVVRAVLDRGEFPYDLTWEVSARPFLTGAGRLTEVLREAVRGVTGRAPALSTTGGTSDARFIAARGVPVAELGLVNRSIHKVDEATPAEDIARLSRIYEAALIRLLAP